MWYCTGVTREYGRRNQEKTHDANALFHDDIEPLIKSIIFNFFTNSSR